MSLVQGINFIQKLKIILNSNVFYLILLVFSLIYIIKYTKVDSNYNLDTRYVIGYVSNIEVSDKNIIYTVKNKENVRVYFNKSNMNINLGDKIKASGTLSSYEENSIFNLFNYKKYMLSKKTYYKMHADNITILKKNTSLLYELKKYIIKRIDKLKTREYLYSFILGYNNYIKKILKLHIE